MKDRARRFGEGAVHQLLRQLTRDGRWPGRAVPPDGPQLRLHRRLGRRRRAAGLCRAAAAGRLAGPGPGGILALVVLRRHPVRQRHPWLLPPARRRGTGPRPDSHHPIAVRHGRRHVVPLRRLGRAPGRVPRRRAAEVRGRRVVRHPGAGRTGRQRPDAPAGTASYTSSPAGSTTSRPASSSTRGAGSPAPTATSASQRSPTPSGRPR